MLTKMAMIPMIVAEIIEAMPTIRSDDTIIMVNNYNIYNVRIFIEYTYSFCIVYATQGGKKRGNFEE